MCYNVLAFREYGIRFPGDNEKKGGQRTMEENENKEKVVDETEDEQDLPEKRDYEEELLKIIKSDEPPQQIAEKLYRRHSLQAD